MSLSRYNCKIKTSHQETCEPWKLLPIKSYHESVHSFVVLCSVQCDLIKGCDKSGKLGPGVVHPLSRLVVRHVHYRSSRPSSVWPWVRSKSFTTRYSEKVYTKLKKECLLSSTIILNLGGCTYLIIGFKEILKFHPVRVTQCGH